MWRAQRVGSVALLLILLAGFAGLLGSGPLSATATGGGAGLYVESERFGRVDARQVMRVRLGAAAAAADGYRVTLNHDFLDRVRLESIIPAPTVAEAVAGGVVYVFAGRPPAGEPAATFEFSPRAPGMLRARIGAPGTDAVNTWQIVYP